MTTDLVKVDEYYGGKEIAPIEEIPFNKYQGISARPFADEQVIKLLEPVASDDVEIRPDGLLYLPEIKYRRRLNIAFGPGAWALMPTERPTVKDNVIMRPYALYVHGRFVAESIGEQEYFENNPQMTWATAAEGAKSNAIMRCCKDLGIASELWDPGFIEKWKKEYAVQVWVQGKNKPLWRRKDREPFYNETGLVGKSKETNKSNPEKVTASRTEVSNFPPASGVEPTEEDKQDNPQVDWDKLEKDYKKPPEQKPLAEGSPHNRQSKDKREPVTVAGCISIPQQKRFWAIAKGQGWSNDQIRAWFKQANIEGTEYIKSGEYNTIIERFQKGPEGE